LPELIKQVTEINLGKNISIYVGIFNEDGIYEGIKSINESEISCSNLELTIKFGKNTFNKCEIEIQKEI